MAKITRQDVIQLARISALNIYEDEIDELIVQMGQVLSYAERVTEVAADIQEPPTRNVNAFREDAVVQKDPEAILSQAPEREGNYFVVPRILESNE